MDLFFRIIEAATLPDRDAITSLRASMALFTEEDDEEGLYLHALAWLDPEQALQACRARPYAPHAKHVQGWLEAYRESQQLAVKSREEQSAYAVLTTLLPEGSPDKEKRQWTQALALARRSPAEFLTQPNWEVYLCLNYLLFARLHRSYPEALRQAIERRTNAMFWPALYNTIGQFLLTRRGDARQVPGLIELVRECATRAEIHSNVLVSYSVSRTLDFLEVHAPEELESLLPHLVTLIGKGRDGGDSELTARVLVQLTRFGPGSTQPLLLWKTRIEQSTGLALTHRWLHDIRRILLRRRADAAPALELLRVFRLLLLAQRIHRRLFRNKRLSVVRAWRGWRWLQRSERVIASVSDPFWQEQLRKKKASMEAEVRKSQRPAHVALITQEAK